MLLAGDPPTMHRGSCGYLATLQMADFVIVTTRSSHKNITKNDNWNLVRSPHPWWKSLCRCVGFEWTVRKCKWRAGLTSPTDLFTLRSLIHSERPDSSPIRLVERVRIRGRIALQPPTTPSPFDLIHAASPESNSCNVFLSRKIKFPLSMLKYVTTLPVTKCRPVGPCSRISAYSVQLVALHTLAH